MKDINVYADLKTIYEIKFILSYTYMYTLFRDK